MGQRWAQWLVVGLVLLVGIALLGWLLLRPAPPRPGPATAGAWYELYLTAPVYPEQPDARRGGIDARLVELIDSAERTIDAAVYDFDLENVAAALAAAQRRGVRVRFVTDTDTRTSTNAEVRRAWAVLDAAGIPVVDDQRGPIMHHKFMVVDDQSVWTGSWNWTVGDTYRLNNNAVKIRSPELAANYRAEFEKMFVQRRFGPTKPVGVPHPRLTIGGAAVENIFTPEQKAAPRIVERLGQAAARIDFMAFSFTHDRIGQAMRDRSRAGVAVRGVFETTGSNTTFSEFRSLQQAGLEVYQDGSPYAMHHKVIVIDRRTTVFGSYNFSANAEDDNDENVLIVDDPGLAEAFLGEVDRMVQLATSPPARRK